jgi:hypothetical protein
LVEEGFITELTVVFTPSGFKAEGLPDARLVGVTDSGLVLGQRSPLGMIASAADKGNLIPLKKKSGSKKTGANDVSNPLPKKTLVKADFEGTDEALFARAKVVASAENGGTLVGRVRSAGKFNGKVTISYQKWWETATVDDRALSLCQSKELAGLTRAHILRLRGMQCPFRGTTEFHVSSDVHGDDED